jgi:pimeloyl-ACP methyl ester carboxylesterase
MRSITHLPTSSVIVALKLLSAGAFIVCAAAALVLAAACGGDGDDAPSPTTSQAEPTTSNTVNPFADPAVEGMFALADGRKLALSCWGDGSPTIILEPGSDDAGIARFKNSPIARDLATSNLVCAYDRAGLGNSDDPPGRPRSTGDMANDLNELLTVAGVERPYVYVASSFGGPIAMRYAALHQDDVAGVVLLDVPSDTDAEGNQLCCLPIAWDDPANPEHYDFSAPAQIVPIDAPLVVVTASNGQSSQEDQSYWLQFSDDSTAVLLRGGHVIYRDDAVGVAQAVRSLLERLPE